jgi:AcrR family transcriptional regulator
MAERSAQWVSLPRDDRRAQLLRCARRVFSERHYGAVSTEEIAREAGVARGLLHHYFGSKRELYLEVVRSMLQMPPDLFPADAQEFDRDELLAGSVDRWLAMVQRNRGTWLATVGAQGFGSDPELETILDEARERIADQLIALLRPGDPAQASPELRGLIRAYAGFAEAASVDWVKRGELTRAQVRELLLEGLLQLVHEVLPRVERARKRKRAA